MVNQCESDATNSEKAISFLFSGSSSDKWNERGRVEEEDERARQWNGGGT
jgi:hypothetical protein